jgi:hypothetical protein
MTRQPPDMEATKAFNAKVADPTLASNLQASPST